MKLVSAPRKIRPLYAVVVMIEVSYSMKTTHEGEKSSSARFTRSELLGGRVDALIWTLLSVKWDIFTWSCCTAIGRARAGGHTYERQRKKKITYANDRTRKSCGDSSWLFSLFFLFAQNSAEIARCSLIGLSFSLSSSVFFTLVVCFYLYSCNNIYTVLHKKSLSSHHHHRHRVGKGKWVSEKVAFSVAAAAKANANNKKKLRRVKYER